jgi:predicted transglutaminase-like cysteine proteinase
MSVLRNARCVSVAAIGFIALSLGGAAAKESRIPFADVRDTAFAAPFNLPQIDASADEPFGLETSAPIKGTLQEKWATVKSALPREANVMARCRDNPETCTPAAKRFLAVIDKAASRKDWARVAEVNRTINLTIKAVDDMTQYGVRDLWASPLMTFASGAGDCEDLAIAKYVALREIGIREEDLRLVIVRDHAANEDHAVTAIHYEGRWLILDNKKLDIREDISIAEFAPLAVIDNGGVKRVGARVVKPQRPWGDARITPEQQSSELAPAPEAPGIQA